jgi:histone chaperone ASF1
LIPPEEIRGVTVMLLICSYLEQEFVRIGYYVDNDFEDEALRENPPSNILEGQCLSLLKRNILADKPRVTRFNIKWDPSKLNEEEDLSELMNIKVDDCVDGEWSDSGAGDGSDDVDGSSILDEESISEEEGMESEGHLAFDDMMDVEPSSQQGLSAVRISRARVPTVVLFRGS